MIPTMTLNDLKAVSMEGKYKVLALLPSESEYANIMTFSEKKLLYASDEFNRAHSDTNFQLYFFIPGIFAYQEIDVEDIIYFKAPLNQFGFSPKEYKKFKDDISQYITLLPTKNYIIYYDTERECFDKIADFEVNFHDVLSYIYRSETLISSDSLGMHMRKVGQLKLKSDLSLTSKEAAEEIFKALGIIPTLLSLFPKYISNFKGYSGHAKEYGSNFYIGKKQYDYKAKKFSYEFDSSPQLWEDYYETNLYASKGYEFADYDCRKDSISGSKRKRVHKRVRYIPKGIDIKMSGDCDFNFNEKKFKKYINLIENLSINPLQKKKLYEKLNAVHLKHYQQENCSLLPTIGGCNNIKGVIISDFDRFDTFLYYVNEYLTKGNDKVLPPLDSVNYSIIKAFFDKFHETEKKHSIYIFCAIMYNRGKELTDEEKSLIDDLISNGSQTIRTEKYFVNYLDLAERWWAFKRN